MHRRKFFTLFTAAIMASQLFFSSVLTVRADDPVFPLTADSQSYNYDIAGDVDHTIKVTAQNSGSVELDVDGNVTTTGKFEGGIESKTENSGTVNISVQGDVDSNYQGVEIRNKGGSNTVSTENISSHTSHGVSTITENGTTTVKVDGTITAEGGYSNGVRVVANGGDTNVDVSGKITTPDSEWSSVAVFSDGGNSTTYVDEIEAKASGVIIYGSQNNEGNNSNPRAEIKTGAITAGKDGVNIDTSYGTIDVETGAINANSAAVTVTASNSDIDVTVKGDINAPTGINVTTNNASADIKAQNIDGNVFLKPNNGGTADVTAGTVDGNINIKTDNGTVSAAFDGIDGNLVIRTENNSSVTVESKGEISQGVNISAKDSHTDVKSQTVTGNVNITADNGTADTTFGQLNGNLTITADNGGNADVTVQTITGDVYIGTDNGSADTTFGNLNGNLIVTADNGGNADVTAQTITGDVDISIDNGTADTTFGQLNGNLTVTADNGGNADVTAQTITGDVDISADNGTASLKSDLIGGDVTVTAQNGSAILNVKEVKGDVSMKGDGAEVTADTITGDLSFDVSSGDITIRTENGSITTTIDAVHGTLTTNSQNAGSSVDLTVSGDIDGSGGTGMVINGSGDITAEIEGSISADKAGVMIDTKADAQVEMLVSETIAGNEVGIRVGNTVTADSVQLTVWQIELNAGGNVVENEKGEAAEEFEKAINYIIKIEQPSNGSLSASYEAGKALDEVNGYQVARETEKVYLSTGAGFRITAAYNGQGSQVPLSRDAGGFYVEVPKGGGIYLVASIEANPEASSRPGSAKASSPERSFGFEFGLNGGTLDGLTGPIYLNAAPDGTLIMPKAPEKDGAEFLYWLSSIPQEAMGFQSAFAAGQTIVTSGPCAFLAVYR